MDKEKEIEEMASIIYSKLNTGTYDNAFDDVGDAVVALQEAGYRKAEEVRKETAKEIEEMANAISKSCEEQIEKNRCASLRCEMCMAEFMTDAGYRKAEEVRKETAKWFIDFLYKYRLNDTISKQDILNFAEKYGVEVDE